MYLLTNNSRRITVFIISEAYSWLYERIEKGEYSTNNCQRARELLIEITGEQKLTSKTYDEFIECFNNEPIWYYMQRNKKKRQKKMTTDNIMNYFLSYNGVPLPLGFVIDFFEDDFEIQRDVDALVRDFMHQAQVDTINKRRNLCNRVQSDIGAIKEQEPFIFKFNVRMFIMILLKTLMTSALIYLLITFIHESRVWDVFITCLRNKDFVGTDGFIYSGSINSYVFLPQKRLDATFSISEYIAAMWPMLLLNIFLFFYTLSNTKKTIKQLVFFIKINVERIRLLFRIIQGKILESQTKIVSDGENAYERFAAATVELVMETKHLSEPISGGVKKPMLLLSLDKFNSNIVLKRTQRIKHRDKYLPYFSESGIKIYPKLGIASICVVIVLFTIINIPQIHGTLTSAIFDFFNIS